MEEKDILNKIVNDEENVVTEEEIEETSLTDDEQGYKDFVDSLEAKWYALHTFSGYENVAKENLETVVEKFNLQDRIFDIVIPMEDVVEEKNGKKKLVQRKSMPCYILAKIKYADDLWHNITRTRGVTGFVGPNGRPWPLTQEEVIKLRLEKIKVEVDLAAGDSVEIVDGALNGMIGKVTEVNTDAGVANVIVEMFGRETAVEVELSQIRKINN
ncbi:MAG: transcription termination/antitermination factor NusG [Clostridia bacterium]|nr:transcription termination/antitermination factor NusG [Clostridia bacterium]